LSGTAVGNPAAASIGRLNFPRLSLSAMEMRLLRHALPAHRIAYGNLVLGNALGMFLREMFFTHAPRLERLPEQ
jgi:hypothetical protein